MATRKPRDASDAPPLDSQAVFNTEQAAQFLGMSPRTLANWRCREDGPKFIRLSRRSVVYRPLDLQEWLRDRTTAPYGAASRAHLSPEEIDALHARAAHARAQRGKRQAER
jgi:predicted DNA-binding transcriptional regulator AlpA